MNPRYIMYGGLVFAWAVIWTLALTGNTLLATTWSLGFSTGVAVVALAVKAKLKSAGTARSGGKVLTPQATPTGDPPHTRLTAIGVPCEKCGGRTREIDHPYGGDSWFFECDQGHHTIIGK